MKEYIRYMLTWTNKEGLCLTGSAESCESKSMAEPWRLGLFLTSCLRIIWSILFISGDVQILLQRTAQVLGYKDEAKKYAGLAKKTKKSFRINSIIRKKGRMDLTAEISLPENGDTTGPETSVIASLKSDIAANGVTWILEYLAPSSFLKFLQKTACRILPLRL